MVRDRDRSSLAAVAMAALMCVPGWSAAIDITRQELTIGAGPFKYDFALLTDCHFGGGSKSIDDMEDFGSPGYNDMDDDSSETTPAEERVRACCEHINTQLVGKPGYDLRFLLVTGDITSSAECSEWERARRVLGSVDRRIQLVPVMGNHDGWPYVGRGLGLLPPSPGFFDEQPEDEVVIGEYFIDAFGGVYDTLRFSLPLPNWEQSQWLLEPTDQTCYRWPSYYNNFAFSYQGCRFITADFNTRQQPPPSERPGLRGEPDVCANQSSHWTLDWLKTQVAAVHPGERIICVGHHAYMAAYANFQANDLRSLSEAGLRNNRPIAASIGGHVHPFGDRYGRSTYGPDTVCDYYAANAAADGKLYVFHVRDSVQLAVTHPGSTFTAGDTVSLTGVYDHEGNGNAPAQFLWDFGDGSMPQYAGLNIGHVFPGLAPDTLYKVSLRVTTASGRHVWACETVRVCTPWAARQVRKQEPAAPTIDAAISIGPNPLVRGIATVNYSVPRPRTATITLYDASGRVVSKTRHALERHGTFRLDLQGLVAGVYLAELNARGVAARQRLVVAR